MTSKLKNLKFFLLPLLVGLSFQAQSAVIGFSPSSSSVDLGESFDVDLTISGLGDDILTGFDLDVNFDDSVLGFAGFDFGTGLDVFGFGLNLQFVNDLGGLVNVFEVSFDFDIDLELFQPDEFVLGTFHFVGIGEGSSGLSVSAPPFGEALSGGFKFDPFLGFEVATALDMEVEAGSVNVPEPGVAFLFATGLLAFGAQRKLNKARV